MHAAVAHQQHQQKQIDDLNRAVMFQRLQQASRPQGPPMGMVTNTYAFDVNILFNYLLIYLYEI